MLKESILKWVGAIFLIGGIFFVALGYGSVFTEDVYDRQMGMWVGTVCTVSMVLPGAVMLFYAIQIHKKEQALDDMATMVKMYRRITLVDVARKMQISEHMAEKLILEAIEKKKVEGYIDRSTNEFFTRESMQQTVSPSKVNYLKCSMCGAPLQGQYLKGETVKCNFCGVMAVATDGKPTTTARTRKAPQQAQRRQEQTLYCQFCGQQVRFIRQYNRWYCQNCRRYL